MKIDISPGELIDRLTILEIKRDRIADQAKRSNVLYELDLLLTSYRAEIVETEPLAALRADLKAVNETLWDVEDEIREHERRRDFGDGFIALARAVYRNNDRRAALKRRINELLDSRLVEEKSYTSY